MTGMPGKCRPSRQSSLAPGQQRAGSLSGAKPSPDSSSSKPAVAFGKLLPPAPTLKAAGSPGSLQDGSEASETASPGEAGPALAHTDLKCPNVRQQTSARTAQETQQHYIMAH